MPYIKKEIRDQLESAIQQLADKMDEAATGDPKALAGILNYTCTRLALDTIPEKRYWAIALFSGVFSNIADEFYRRYASPYEDEQIEKNGDVYG